MNDNSGPESNFDRNRRAMEDYIQIVNDNAVADYLAKKKKDEDDKHLAEVARQLRAAQRVDPSRAKWVRRNRLIVAIVGFGLFFVAWGLLIATEKDSHIGKVLWGHYKWYSYLGFVVVFCLVFLFYRIIYRYRIGWLLPSYVRIYPQIFCVVFSLFSCTHITDRASIPPAFFLSLSTIPACLLLGVPDDFGVFDCFIGMALSGILGHYKQKAEGWRKVAIYVAVLLNFKYFTMWILRKCGVHAYLV